MKKIILTFCVLTVSIVLFLSASAQNQTTMQTYKAVKGETVINAGRGSMDVLVIRNYLPWSYDVTVPLLEGLGATVSTADSWTYPGIDFSQFGKIVIESVQGPDFYSDLLTNMAQFETYVNNGGILEIHGTTQGIEFSMPGGVISRNTNHAYCYQTLPGHPILAGVIDPMHGDWATHNYLDNLPGSAQILTRGTGTDLPTTATYTIGSGMVIATTLTMEIAYFYQVYYGPALFDFAVPMYPQMLQYGLTPEPPVETPVSNWAILIGIALILSIAAIRFRKIA